MSPATRAAAVLIPLAALGCASSGGLRQEPLNAGVARTYAAPLNRVLSAARQAMGGADVTIEEATQPAPNSWMLMGKKGTSAWSWGELVRVVCEEATPGQTTVRVITKRRSSVNITATGDWSRSMLDQIQVILTTGGS